MKDTTTILSLLRLLLIKQTPKPLAAYIVPSDDAHQSEYICAHDERRAFLTGFDGSAGTAVVTGEKALLWTDGRYYQQAGEQLDENWTLMKDGLPNTPSIGQWLATNLPKGSGVGVDPKLFSYRLWSTVQKDLNDAGCELIAVEQNLIDLVWGKEQPERTLNPILPLDLKFTGTTIAEKWSQVKKQFKEKKAHAVVVSALDEVAWFLNLRGSDIEYNPVFFAYLIVTESELHLFVDSNQLPETFKKHQENNNVNVVVHPYENIGEYLKDLTSHNYEKVWISPGSSYYLMSLVPESKRHVEITAIAINKSVKNEVEIKGFINSHVRDGVALCQFFAWLEKTVLDGEYVDEISAATKLEAFRAKRKHFMGLSFATISASGPNGSVIHYHPEQATNHEITAKEVYLCDSGAQYLDGTTDVTRTMHFGEPTDFQKETFTRVLKGQLNLGSAVFPNKVKGQFLDTIARKALWDVGLDYAHGTGHGVGHYLNVHEGPMGISFRLNTDDQGLQENMILSNEPGFYKDGEFGIRIEDLVRIVPANVPYDFAGRGALTFKTITMCPKQTKLIKKELLNNVEIQQLNDYHEEVWKMLAPILKEENDTLTLDWLKRETTAI